MRNPSQSRVIGFPKRAALAIALIPVAIGGVSLAAAQSATEAAAFEASVDTQRTIGVHEWRLQRETDGAVAVRGIGASGATERELRATSDYDAGGELERLLLQSLSPGQGELLITSGVGVVHDTLDPEAAATVAHFAVDQLARPGDDEAFPGWRDQVQLFRGGARSCCAVSGPSQPMWAWQWPIHGVLDCCHEEELADMGQGCQYWGTAVRYAEKIYQYAASWNRSATEVNLIIDNNLVPFADTNRPSGNWMIENLSWSPYYGCSSPYSCYKLQVEYRRIICLAVPKPL